MHLSTQKWPNVSMFEILRRTSGDQRHHWSLLEKLQLVLAPLDNRVLLSCSIKTASIKVISAHV